MSIDLGFGMHPKWLGRGTRDAFLGPLRAAGMSVLEFTLHPEAEDWPPMQALVEECMAAGYTCHFHAPYQAPYNPAGFAGAPRDAICAQYAPALEFVERCAAQQHFNPSLVIHGPHAMASRAELRRDTEQFLAWILAETRYARPMLEILPHKLPFTRTGTSREEVLDIVLGMNQPRLGVCWDLGHDYLLDYAELPSEAFLRAVRHVHIHDIDAARQDHFPLVFGNVPWQADLRALVSVGFEGAIVMEINGHRAQAVERLPERMAESFAAMRETIRDA
jgi:sugar phosphate isomerase/epimerase